MTEFKQIIGRGTRVFDGKDYFTIIDFTGATNLFYDPAWDGEQLVDNVIANDTDALSEDKQSLDEVDRRVPRDDNSDEDDTPPEPTKKLRVKLGNNRELKIINIETRYIDETGKPMSATEYLTSLIGKLPALYQSEEQLRQLRADPKTREDLLKQLEII